MHLFSLRSSLGLVLGTVFAAGAIAQSSPNVILPSRVEQGVLASPINTESFFPQIDESFDYHPLHPENPIQRNIAKSKDSKLPVGGVTKSKRGTDLRQWPAIGATGWTPPDCDLAVGPNHIVATVNSSIGFFSKAGSQQFLQTSSTFFAGLGAGSFQYDPKCFYDRVAGRFVILFLEEDDATVTSKVLVAVSDDSDPNGTWYRYRLEAKLVVGANSYWLDYPGFGYNKDAYVISGNMFGFVSGSAGIQYLVIPKAPLLSGGVATVFSLRDTTGFSAQVAEMISTTSPVVFAASRLTTASLRIAALQNLTTIPTLVNTSVAVPSYGSPSRDANSTNSQFLDSLDGRLYNVFWRDGRLVTGHTINGTMLASRWYEINTGNWPTSGSVTLNQSGNLSSPTQDYHMVALTQNWQGDTSAIFTGSSATITADIVRASRTFWDAAGTMGAPVVLESSAGNNYTSFRWGDYFGIDVDPTDDNTFWGIGMGVASNNNWRTSVFSWVVTPPLDLNAVTVSPTQVVGGNNVTGTVTLNHVAPPGGAQVTLVSSDPSVVVPASVTVLGNNTSVNFNITTNAVTAITQATITATWMTTNKQATLKVLPVSMQLLGNTDFEAGLTAAPWVPTPLVIDNNAALPAHGGSWKAKVGGYNGVHQDTLSQDVTIPAEAASASLKYWLYVKSTEASGRNGSRTSYDWLYVRIRDTSGALLQTMITYTNNNAGAGYVERTVDVSAYKGRTIRVSFESEENAAIPSYFLLDDVTLTAFF